MSDDLIWINRERAVTCDHPSQQVLMPNLRVEFLVMPSWNQYIALSQYPTTAQAMVKKWREAGARKGLYFAERAGWKVNEWTEHGFTERGNPTATVHRKIDPPIFSEDVKIVLRFWRPNWGHYDVFTPFAKPIVDGFKDAGIIIEDNCERLPSFSVQFMGVDPKLKLSKEAKEARKIKKLTRKGALDPLPARYWFDFYTSLSGAADRV